ncbi:MAG TPA: FN3 associated domain-containing protein, partial [Ignavibacteriales bacterium]|nr:FN3 associated domain-containing protein [Ignavibacteriales bacterium]
ASTYYYKTSLTDITNGSKQAALVGTMPNLGIVRSTTGAGDVSIKDNGDGTFTFYNLGPNNGVAAHTTNAPSVTPVFASLGVKYHTMKDSIKITSTSYGAKIYYTLDNSEPTSTSGTLYTAPFTVNTNGAVVKAAAYGDLFKSSAVGEYTVSLPTTPAAVPVITNTGKRDYFTSVEKVAIASSETGAEIYYTLDGTDPNYKSTAYADTLLVSFGATVKAVVYAPDRIPSSVASSVVTAVTDTAKPVAFSVPSGYHENNFEVALTSATTGAKIYFTLDGATPDYTDSLYTDTLLIFPDAYAKRTVKAIAYADGFLPSKVDSVNYTFPVNEKLNKPTFTVNYDYYNNVNLVVISAGDTAKAYYTTNGSIPTVSSTEFTDTLSLSVNTKIKAIAYTPGYMPSDVDSVDVVMPTDTVKALAFTPEGGQYDADQTVTITTATEGAEIYYTLDGKAPSYKSTLYTAAISVPLNTTLKAIAYAPGKVRAKATSAAYLHRQLPLYPVWGKSRNFGGYPWYFGSATDRGMAYGKVGGKDRVYVISRRVASAPDILIYDAATGDSVGTLPTTGTGVGYFPLNAIDVSDDGVIFATNMTLDATGERPFIVYLWENETSTAFNGK